MFYQPPNFGILVSKSMREYTITVSYHHVCSVETPVSPWNLIQLPHKKHVASFSSTIHEKRTHDWLKVGL